MTKDEMQTLVNLFDKQLQQSLEPIKEDLTFIKNEIKGHTMLLEHLSSDTVSQEEHKELKERIRKLERL